MTRWGRDDATWRQMAQGRLVEDRPPDESFPRGQSGHTRHTQERSRRHSSTAQPRQRCAIVRNVPNQRWAHLPEWIHVTARRVMPKSPPAPVRRGSASVVLLWSKDTTPTKQTGAWIFAAATVIRERAQALIFEAAARGTGWGMARRGTTEGQTPNASPLMPAPFPRVSKGSGTRGVEFGSDRTAS